MSGRRARFAALLAGTALAIALGLGTEALRADGESQYPRDAREQHITGALAAIDRLGKARLDALYLEVYEGARDICRSAFGPPTISCLLALGIVTCDAKPQELRADCRVLSDVIITNQLSEHEFVDDTDRLALMNKSENFRTSMRAELHMHYAALVTGLALSPAFSAGEGLAPAIDEFCEDYASTRQLVWQRCVAGILWYIGTDEPGGTQ